MAVKQTPRLDDHWIDPEALQIVRTLQRRGFTTYLVGGCVRDLLLGKQPKDFDIATTARPEDVRRNIRPSFIIGKRFRLVLVKRGDAQYEVATFRRDPRPEENGGEITEGDNVFGTPEDDAKRRDFTINALFYDPVKRRLIDYSRGVPDLEAGVVRMIGNPVTRIQEDPIRTLRGIRLAHMIGFSIERSLRAAMMSEARELEKTPLPRRREEFLKFLRLEDPVLPFMTSLDFGVLEVIAPKLSEILADREMGHMVSEFLLQLHSDDLHSPVELFATLVLAILLARRHGDFHDEIRSRDVLEDEVLGPIMRNELGVFKGEQSQIARAVQMMHILQDAENFAKKGERRRQAVVHNEAFPLAIKLAERIPWTVEPRHLHFWKQESLNAGDRPRAARPRRRRRRKPSSPGGSSAAQTPESKNQ